MNATFLRLARSVPFAAAALLTAPALWAHHSFAMFDAKQTFTVHATVKDFQWGNPHTWLDVVTDAQKPLSLELNGISGLMQAGWKPNTLKPGDTVTVMYHPVRDGKPAGELVELITADGTKLRGFGAPGQAPAQGVYQAPGN